MRRDIEEHNRPQSPNVLKAWRVAFDEIPECPLKRQALTEIAAFAERFTDDLRKAFLKAFAKPLAKPFEKPLPIQEQEQYQEQEAGAVIPPLRPPKGAPAPGFAEFFTCYPNKANEVKAREQWNKLRPDEELRATIQAAVKAHAASRDWADDGGRYIPHAWKWLKNKRWADPLATRNNGHVSRRNVNAAWERPGAELVT